MIILTGWLAYLVSAVARLMWAEIGLGFVALIVLVVLNSTISGSYKAAVYRHAAQGQVAQQFDAALIQHAFRLKGALA